MSGSQDLGSPNSSDIHPSRVLTSLASIPFNPLFLTHFQPAYPLLLTCFLTPSVLIPHFSPAHQPSIDPLSPPALSLRVGKRCVNFKLGHVAAEEIFKAIFKCGMRKRRTKIKEKAVL